MERTAWKAAKVTTKIYSMINCVHHIAYRVQRTTKRYGFTPLEVLTKGQAQASRTLFLTGFTLTEALLVIVIIALIGGVGGGFYVGTYKRLQAEKSAKDFLLAAKYARITAIERQQPCKIVLDVANNQFALVAGKFSEETKQVEQEIVRDVYFRPVEFAGDVKFEGIQITPLGSNQIAETDEDETTIVFLPDGTAQSAVIQMGDGRSHYTVGICAATGKAKMYVGTAEGVNIGTIDLDEKW